MPRKTRKEKYAAKIHKMRSEQHKSEHISPPQTSVKDPPISAATPRTSPKTSSARPIFEDQIRTYFIQDLRKSLMVIVGILILEGTLYFAVSKGLLRLFNY